MIDVLIAGKLHKKPQQHTAKNGKPFATATIRAATGDGGSLFVNCIAFDDVSALLALDAGDSISVAGSATPKAWIDDKGNARPSMDMVAHAVISAYSVQRKRQAAQDKPEPSPRQAPDKRWDAWDAQH